MGKLKLTSQTLTHTYILGNRNELNIEESVNDRDGVGNLKDTRDRIYK